MTEPRDVSYEDTQRDPWLRGKQPAESLEVRSIVSFTDEDPKVQLALGDRYVTLSPSACIEQAHFLLEAAEAARADGFLFAFARDRMKAADHEGAGLVRMFREFKVGLWNPNTQSA